LIVWIKQGLDHGVVVIFFALSLPDLPSTASIRVQFKCKDERVVLRFNALANSNAPADPTLFPE